MPSHPGTPPVVPDAPPSGPSPEQGTAPARKGLFRRCLLPCLLLLVLLPVLAGTGGILWLRSPDGQTWLRESVEAALAPALAAQGLSLELTSLSGRPPLELDCSLRLKDGQGPWLDVPQARAALGVSLLPPRLWLDVRLRHPSLYRLPRLAPAPEEPAEALAVTLAGVEDALRATLEALAGLPGWLPAVRIEEISVEDGWLGAAVLADSHASVDAESAASLAGGAPTTGTDASAATAAGAPGRDAPETAATTGSESAQTATAPSSTTAPANKKTAAASDAPHSGAATPTGPQSAPLPVPDRDAIRRTGEGLSLALRLTAEAAFAFDGTTAQADLRGSWRLARAAATDGAPVPALPDAAATSSAPLPVPAADSGTAAAPTATVSAPVSAISPAAAGDAPVPSIRTATSPASSQAAAASAPATSPGGQWLPGALALLLTPGQASELHVSLGLRPGEQPQLLLEHLDADAGAVRLRSKGSLALPRQGDALAAPLHLSCALRLPAAAEAAALLPQARPLLAPLGEPLRLTLGITGSPGAPEPRLELGCARLDLGGHSVEDLDLHLGGEALAWPQLAEEGRVELPLSLRVRTGKDHVSVLLRLLAGHDSAGWLLGLPHLELHGAGGHLEGALLALLPEAAPPSAPVTVPQAAALPMTGTAPLPAAPAVSPVAPDTAGASAPVPPAPLPVPAPETATSAPAPAIVAGDFAPARVLERFFPDPQTRPRLWASLDAELEDWAALGRVLDYWSPGLRLEGSARPARLVLRAGGLPLSPDQTVPPAPRSAAKGTAAESVPSGAPAAVATMPGTEAAPGAASSAGIPAPASDRSGTSSPAQVTASGTEPGSIPAPVAPDSDTRPESVARVAAEVAAALADPAFRTGQGWAQWLRLDADVERLRLHDRSGERLLLRELRQRLLLEDIFGQGIAAQRLELRRLHAGGLRLERVLLGLTGRLATPLELELAAAGDVRARARMRWQGDSLEIPVCDVRLQQGMGLHLRPGSRLVLDRNGLVLRGLDASLSPSGRLRGSASLTPAAMDLRLSLDHLDLAPWAAIVPGLPPATLTFQSRLHGSSATPAGEFRLDVRRLTLPQTSLPPLDLALTGKLGGSRGKGHLDARLELPPPTRQALGAAQAGLEARLPLHFTANGLPLPDMGGPLSGRLDWQGRLAPLWRLVPVANRRVSGSLDLHATLAGSLAAPTGKGRLEIAGGRYEDLDLGILLTDIRATVAAGSGKGFMLEPVRVEASMSDGRGGQVSARGSLSPRNGRLDVDAAMKRLRPLRRSDIQATLSGTASVGGTLTAPRITADISIDEAVVNLNRLSGGSVTTLPVEGTSEAPEPVSKTKTAVGSLDVRVRAPGRIQVNGHGLESEWQAGLRVRGALTDPLVVGSVRSVRGQFDLLSKRFTLRPSAISFNGGPVSNPLLDVTLRYEVPEITADVRVSGTVRRMKLELSSTPSLPQEEIISRIMFGRGSSELGRFESLRLAAAVARLAGFGSGGFGVLDLGRSLLGVDVLRINSSTDKTSGDEESSLEVGKFIGEKIYLGVEQGLGPNGTAVIIELEITPHSKAGIRTEQDNTSAGIQWKMNY